MCCRQASERAVTAEKCLSVIVRSEHDENLSRCKASVHARITKLAQGGAAPQPLSQFQLTTKHCGIALTIRPRTAARVPGVAFCLQKVSSESCHTSIAYAPRALAEEAPDAPRSADRSLRLPVLTAAVIVINSSHAEAERAAPARTAPPDIARRWRAQL